MKKTNKISLVIVVLLLVSFTVVALTAQTAGATTEKERAIEEVRNAIRALPDRKDLTAADKPAVEEALRLAHEVMTRYDLTEYDICVLSAKLAAAASKVGARVDDVDETLPRTGGTMPLIPAGLFSVFTGVALLATTRRK